MLWTTVIAGGPKMAESTPLQIRPATKEDVPLILTFIRELAEYERASDRVSATESGLQATLFGARAYAYALIAFAEAQPVAFALYFFSYTSFSAQPSLYLEDIFVRPAARGSGFGRQLFAFLAQKAIEANCARMEWSVLNWNSPAFGFYESLGAEPVRDWTVFHLSREKLHQLTTETTS
jgi:GNAT superfamily N-acetyltransferase